MTPRQKTILEKLKLAGTATTTELVEWCGCERRDALLTLGLMVRVGQLFRVGWTGRPGSVAIWSHRSPSGRGSAFERDLAQAVGFPT